MKIISTATSFPNHYYPQSEITTALGDYWQDALKKREVMERFHRNAGVEGRHLAMPVSEFPKVKDWGESNDIFIQQAVSLGENVISKALAEKAVQANQISALTFVSITGISNPSIDARLMNHIDFPSNLKRTPIFGLGCVGGAAGIARTADYLRAYPDQMALLLSVELCSLTWQRADLTPAHVISSALFGDGAAAVLMCGSDLDHDGPTVVDTQSSFYRGTEDLMGWNITADGFRVLLSPDVPKVVLEHLRSDVDQLLGKHGLKRADIGQWIMHTGGPKVLEATQKALDLPREALDVSWQCLSDMGNLSSASVLAVLDRIIRTARPPKGTWSVMSAMGPGFCSELVLIKW